MKAKYSSGQHVYFLICGRYITEATIVTASSWFVTIRFNKQEEDCIIRLPHSRIYLTKEEAREHIRPDLPPMQSQAITQDDRGEFVTTRRWDQWE